jgi:predicted small integral membrane protein
MGKPPRPPGGRRGRTLELEWMTITYRTIAFYAFLALLLAGFALYLISPRFVNQKMRQGLEAVVGDSGRITSSEAAATHREAHFVNLDGLVRVKKARSLEWIRADYNTSLEKGDFVQTGSEGVARIIFADGTN